MTRTSTWLTFGLLLGALPARAADKDLAALLREYDAGVIVRGKVRQPPLASMLARDVEARLRAANRADAAAWQKVKNKADWERFRDERLKALRKSLSEFPPVPKDLKLHVSATHEGDGYVVDNLVFQSRPGLVVTANLYRPAKPGASMPGIIVSHSHNSAKQTGARQYVGMTWARAGCVVLVPDHLGHGERRQHPFGEGVQHDYQGRYDLGIQLHLIGESLMGWLVWDLMRGVDVLLARKGVDAKRIVLISEPAGGGDVAAVTAALDERITGVMVQNFGGPQPETAYPLPRDAETSFAYAGSGSWESTRNLRQSARDGFLPWFIVAASAPRRLIYYHEFYWDGDEDPVWKRLRRVFGFYDAKDSLVGLSGRGFVVGDAPENTHWLAINREVLYPTMERWFRIPNPKKEYSKRRPTTDLLCLTAEVRKELKPVALHELANRIGAARTAAARKEHAALSLAKRREKLRKDWARLLGDVAPQAKSVVKGMPLEEQKFGGVTAHRIHLGTEPGIVVPVLLLLPAAKKDPAPVVVCVAQEGKQVFLRKRSGPIAELLSAGVAVCLPDVRGTGETSPGAERGRRSAATAASSSEWMLGESVLAGRLRDLRSVLAYLRQRKELDGERVALWGDSFAAVNTADRDLKVAHNEANRPAQSEPLGGLVALLGALYEDVRAVHVNGGLSDYHSLLDGPLAYAPHDAVVPGIVAAGDLCDVAAALAPRPLRLENLVDGHNRAVAADTLRRRYAPAITAYTQAKARDEFLVAEKPDKDATVADWLARRLRK